MNIIDVQRKQIKQTLMKEPSLTSKSASIAALQNKLIEDWEARVTTLEFVEVRDWNCVGQNWNNEITLTKMHSKNCAKFADVVSQLTSERNGSFVEAVVLNTESTYCQTQKLSNLYSI